MLVAPVPLLLLLVPLEFVFAFEFELAFVAELEHPSSSYNFPVEESYFMALYPRDSVRVVARASGHDQRVEKFPRDKYWKTSFVFAQRSFSRCMGKLFTGSILISIKDGKSCSQSGAA